MIPADACPHPDFDVDVRVIRLADEKSPLRFTSEVEVRCHVCAMPFVFGNDLPIGLDLAGGEPMTNLFGTELRVGIRPLNEVSQ